MYDRAFIGNNVTSFSDSPQFDGFSKVIINVTDEIQYTAGTDTGRTLTVFNPWGTQEMANNILSKIQGVQYQPYKSTGTIIDPSMELGDAVTVRGVYGGVYSKRVKFGKKLRADISATSDEEIEHEFPYISKQDRKVTRQFKEAFAQLSIQADRITAEVSAREDAVNEINAQLAIQADQISAKVSQTGGNSSSFAWELLSTAFKLKSNGKDVFIADRNGVQVVGKITATSGKIGGFDIKSNYISYNNQTWGGTNTTGIYIGANGVQLGRNFRVDNQGNLYATSGTFTGAVSAGNIQYGGDDGYMSGYGIGSHTVSGNRLQYNTVSTSYTSGGINTSLGYADWAYGALNGWTLINNLNARSIASTADMTAENFYINGYKISRKSGTFKNSSGENQFIRYLSW